MRKFTEIVNSAEKLYGEIRNYDPANDLGGKKMGPKKDKSGEKRTKRYGHREKLERKQEKFKEEVEKFKRDCPHLADQLPKKVTDAMNVPIPDPAPAPSPEIEPSPVSPQPDPEPAHPPTVPVLPPVVPSLPTLPVLPPPDPKTVGAGAIIGGAIYLLDRVFAPVTGIYIFILDPPAGECSNGHITA